MPRRLTAAPLAALIVLVCAGAAAGHARVSPPVSLAGKLQLYSLAVPTEKSNLTTTKIVMTVPSGFGIDSFAPPPAGWAQSIEQTGSDNNAVITRVTWTGGHTPTGEDSLFQFLAQPASAKTYTFDVQQTYSDGSIVDWTGPESSAEPAPTIEVQSSFGGGVSLLTIIALILGALGVLAGGFALISGTSGGSGRAPGGRGRPLA